MSGLVEFLQARIAEDEAAAKEAIARRRAVEYCEGHEASRPDYQDFTLEAFEDVGVPAMLIGPERVLAECAAKRRIVELHEPGIDAPCVSDGCMGNEYGCDTLVALAAIYADHPDYREEWR